MQLSGSVGEDQSSLLTFLFFRVLSYRRSSSALGSWCASTTPSSRISRVTYSFQSSKVSRRRMLFIAHWLQASCCPRPPSCPPPDPWPRLCAAQTGIPLRRLPRADACVCSLASSDREFYSPERCPKTVATTSCRHSARQSRVGYRSPRNSRPIACENRHPVECSADRAFLFARNTERSAFPASGQKPPLPEAHSISRRK